MPTLSDVAAKAAVSPATVSLVLRDAPSVRPETRRRVQAAVGELGYKRRRAGRPSKSPKGLNIAIAYPGASVHLADQARTAATRRWFVAIREDLRRRGHHLNFFGGDMEGGPDHLFQEVVSQGEVDGVIFIGPAAQPEHVAWVGAQGVPALAINRRPERDEFSYVEIDNRGGGRCAAEHFASLGHRRIVMVRSQAPRPHNQHREAGFREAMHRLQLEPAIVDEVEPDGPADRLADLCRQLLKQGVTALFCEGDKLAIQFTNELGAMGVDVPGEMSVLGADDTGLTSKRGLRISSIGFDSRVVGQCAADLKLKLIQHRSNIVNLSLKVRTFVVEHDTTAKASGRSI